VQQHPDQWQRIEDLFDQVLDAGDLGPLDSEADPDIAMEVRKLWQQHLEATEQGFLNEPVAMVQNMLDHVGGAIAPKDETPAFEPGAVLASRFLITRLLGQGGMGQVYLAEDQKLGGTVAIKTILPSLAQNPSIRRRFIEEINSARRVTHPNVCRLFDLFEEGQTPVCTMEYLPGPTLDGMLREESAISLKRATADSIILQLAEGLHAAHLSGIIHRDFKPQNVILVPSTKLGGMPRAVITDFGLARAVTAERFATDDHTQSLRAAGTLDYMAPELFRGDSATVKSDIFAFGKVLAKVLPDSRWIARCTAEDPAERLESLEPILEEWRGSNGMSRRQWLTGAGILIAAAGGAGYAAYRSQQPRYPLMSSRQRALLNGLQADAQLADRATTLRQLLIAGLRQSPLLGLIPDDRLLALLRRSKHPAVLPAPLEHLFEAAKAEKAAIVLEGIAERAAVRGLRLLIRVFEPGRKSAVLELARTVDDEQDMVQLAQDVAMDLRKEFAESSQSRRSSFVPLEQLTSSSPEAVDLYFRAVREYEQADANTALAWIDRALAIDPNFVLAHHYRGQILMGLSQLKSALEASTIAFQARSRVTDRERNAIEYLYYYLSYDYVRALEACRKNQIVFPEEALFERQVATACNRLARYDEAIPHSRQALELGPDSPSNHNELIANLAEGNRFQEALISLERSRISGMNSALLFQGEGLARMVEGDYGKATTALTAFRQNPAFDRWGRITQTACDVLQGKFVEAVQNVEADLAYDDEIKEERHRSLRLVYAAWLRQMLSQKERSTLHVQTLSMLEAVPASILPLREAIVVAGDGSLPAVQEAINKLRFIEKTWPSTYSRGARAHAQACLMGTDLVAAGDLFREAMGLWVDPLTVFSYGRWLSQQGKPDEAVRMLDGMNRFRGKTIRHYFSGMIGLARIESGKSFVAMARFADALRVFDQVLQDWGSYAKDTDLVSRIRGERDNLLRLKA
jgi:serine/threonine protein kinase/Tfp pilus assembly protein PilF